MNEITFENHEAAFEVARKLLDEDYVVMLSKEEQLVVINYEWSPTSNRNDVVFMQRDEFDDKYVEVEDDCDCGDSTPVCNRVDNISFDKNAVKVDEEPQLIF